MSNEVEKHNPQLYNDLCQLIDGARIRIATTVNAKLVGSIGISANELRKRFYIMNAQNGKEIT